MRTRVRRVVCRRHNTICGREELAMSEHDDIDNSGRYSRGRFLGSVGVGAVAIGTGGALRVGTANAVYAVLRQTTTGSVTTSGPARAL